jgi:hypothetical protein
LPRGIPEEGLQRLETAGRRANDDEEQIASRTARGRRGAARPVTDLAVFFAAVLIIVAAADPSSVWNPDLNASCPLPPYSLKALLVKLRSSRERLCLRKEFQ